MGKGERGYLAGGGRSDVPVATVGVVNNVVRVPVTVAVVRDGERKVNVRRRVVTGWFPVSVPMAE